jgi:hypothetical protein
MPDTVQVRCSRCKSCFRDRARRVRSGYSRECPSCSVLIFFEDGGSDENTQRALRNARKIRSALLQA